MAIAEMAEALFATVDANAIMACGTAVQEISKLYGALGSSIDTAHQTLFSGDNSWSGSAANSAQTSMTNLSSANGNIQSALSTIGQTLTEYGTALQPYQKKTYPTPIEGSRDPEAAADLAVVGAASALAGVGIGTAVLQMMPIANPGSGQNTAPNPGTIPNPTTPPSIGQPKVPALPNFTTHLSSIPNALAPLGSTPFGSSLPGLNNGLLPGVPGAGDPLLTPGMLGAGAGLGTAASQAAESAAAEEGMPMMPMAGGNRNRSDSERNRTIAFVEDPDFWTEDQPPTVEGVITAPAT